MDPIQTATFSAYSPWARSADAAVVRQDQARDQSARVQETERDDGIGTGLGEDAAAARQAAGQEVAASEDSSAGGNDSRRDGPAERGQTFDIVA